VERRFAAEGTLGLTEVQESGDGLAARRVAARCLDEILERKRLSDEVLGRDAEVAALAPRDRAFLHALLLTALRHLGQIDHALASVLERPLPRKSGAAMRILEIAAAQLLFMAMAPHAVVDTAVRQAKADPGARHFSGVINGVLRNLARNPEAALRAAGGPERNIPGWCWTRWVKTYGAEAAAGIAAARLVAPALDLTPVASGTDWARRLNGRELPTGSIRLAPDHGAVEELPGYGDGAWFVQDAAAAVPARLLGDVRGLAVLDLCAAPGGKTLQLAAAGAQVTAVDKSAARLVRLSENLARTGLTAEVVTGDAETALAGRGFDAVLLDAPCSATGTLRRHPEVLLIKSESQVREMAVVQRRLLAAAARLVRPGGLLVFCTCSLEPEEGEAQAEYFLGRETGFVAVPLEAGEAGLPSHLVTAAGWFRARPDLALGESSGMDGFFAARFRRL
jgi:16S rRNA (cytosine967-C5)-methyltransferase